MSHPNEDYRSSAMFEHRFWLQIMGDHARFILQALAPAETANIAKAEYFQHAFDRLLHESRSALSDAALEHLNRSAYRYVEEFKEFKLQLIRSHLSGCIAIGLTPSFINHMVNELEEYWRVLKALMSGRPAPQFHPVHHHLLWLQDGFGHAAAIAAEMDFAEKSLIERSKAFEKTFSDFYLKAVEMAGFLRTRLHQFPALSRFNRQVELEMLMFQKFLHELKEMELSKEVLSTFAPLMADHMYREECYYLTKLSQVSEVERPHCDPARPRLETGQPAESNMQGVESGEGSKKGR